MLMDPLSDAMSNLKNSERAGKSECIIQPASKVIATVLKVMQDTGYIGEFEFVDNGKAGVFRVQLLGRMNECGVIRPRSAVGFRDFEKFEKRFLPAKGFGKIIVSTSKGVIPHDQAVEQRIGGRLLAYIY